jgi:hypothetical protein
MQDGGDQAFGIEPHAREDAGNGNRVMNVGFARAARLSAVGARTELIGALYVGDLRRSEVILQLSAECANWR